MHTLIKVALHVKLYVTLKTVTLKTFEIHAWRLNDNFRFFFSTFGVVLRLLLVRTNMFFFIFPFVILNTNYLHANFKINSTKAKR